MLSRLLIFATLTIPALPIEARTYFAKKRTHGGSSHKELEQQASLYNQTLAERSERPICSPVTVAREGQVNIIYLHCSDEALARDGEGVKISENFSVPDGIARRYNFWRRIYSIWGIDHYVMHVSEYPEVVIAALDGTQMPDRVSPQSRESIIKRVAKTQRTRFQNLLLSMHRQRHNETAFTPAMLRISRQMQHISDPNKYSIAARSLRLQRGQRDFIATGLSIAPKYLPAIERDFIEQGIPVEISRLAFVESSFNLKAVSKVGASGVYQIMPATGRQYLKIDGRVDERNDPIKAAKAACKLLKLNYRLTGNWPLAITAYNHGVGGIRRAVHTVNSNDIVALINRYNGKAFGFASKNFYASFLGILATLKDADRLFPNVQSPDPLVFETIKITRPTSIRALSTKHNLNLLKLAELNPDLSRSVARGYAPLPIGFVLKIPAQKRRDSDGKINNRQVPNS